jgi:glutamyl-tRNA reductase
VTPAIAALLAHARQVPSAERHELALGLRREQPDASVLVETCHRVELYGPADEVTRVAAAASVPGATVVEGQAAARHAISLAVGRTSAVLAEDQVLHQLRVAVQAARARGTLPPELDQLFDHALRGGRRARTWLPAHRPSLADVAVETGIELEPAGEETAAARPILVVGAGRMGALAAAAARRRGRPVMLASRSAQRSVAVAESVGAEAVPFDPQPTILSRAAGVVVALAGPWRLGTPSMEALEHSRAWVVDLSSPPALDAGLRARLGVRFVSVDDLAGGPATTTSTALAARLDRLVDDTLAEYLGWLAHGPDRAAARALADRAEEARTAELASLWQRIGPLDPGQREEVERMAERLAARLLRDPLERLSRDEDGRHREAARELFRL